MSRDWTYLLWREKTWGERGQTVICFIIALVIALAMFIGGLLVVGEALDGIGRYQSEHNRCLQKATNGYEIKQCR